MADAVVIVSAVLDGRRPVVDVLPPVLVVCVVLVAVVLVPPLEVVQRGVAPLEVGCRGPSDGLWWVHFLGVCLPIGPVVVVEFQGGYLRVFHRED